MKIAIVAAMREELEPFRAAFSSKALVFEKGPIQIEQAGDSLLLVRSGIGKANAACASVFLCEKFAPDLIINTGTTGSFNQEAHLGDVVVSPTFRYSDVDATGFDYAWGQVPQMPVDYPVDKDLLEQVIAIVKGQATDYNVHEGFIATSDSFMSSVDNVAAIREKLPHIFASDMESAALAQVASFYNIPIVNIRGISDHAGGNAAELFDETLELAAHHASVSVIHLVQQLQASVN